MSGPDASGTPRSKFVVLLRSFHRTHSSHEMIIMVCPRERRALPGMLLLLMLLLLPLVNLTLAVDPASAVSHVRRSPIRARCQWCVAASAVGVGTGAR